MIISIKPSDIIKRCLWLEYKRFCLKDKTDDEINLILEENKPTIIKEEDAYVIGLLKVVDTPHIVHRFKEHIKEILLIRSNMFNNKLYIIKSVALKEISSFKLRFPNGYKPPFEYKTGIENMYKFVDYVCQEVEKLPTSQFQSQDKIYTYISSNSIRDIIEEKE